MTKKQFILITILSLVICFPLGIFLMFYWKLWNTVIRILISIVAVIIIGIFIFFILSFRNYSNDLNQLLDNGFSDKVSIENTKQFKEKFIIPNKDLYESNENISANGLKIKDLNMTLEKYQDKVTDTEEQYCAITMSLTNILDSELSILPNTHFSLVDTKPEVDSQLDTNFNFILNNEDIAKFITQPKDITSIVENDNQEITVPSNAEKKFFLPFSCINVDPNNKNNQEFILTVDINQFHPIILSENLEYQPIRIKLKLS
jgi:hypothetical protein